MSDPTAFLYPFIDREERDTLVLVSDMERSAAAKFDWSRTLRDQTLQASESVLREAGAAMGERLKRGGRLFFFGNGGSSTDADGMADLFDRPPWGRPLPARSLVENQAVLTALANDVGFDLVFSRQLIAHARPGDVAVGFSTSGQSADVLEAFDEAARRDVLTVGFAGYDGGAMARRSTLRYCLVVASDSVHRVQEVQNALAWRLWEMVQEHLERVGAL